MKIKTAAAFLVIPVLFHFSAAAEVQISEPAPAFTLEDSNGKKVDSNDLKGKVVVLEWTNPDCPYVKRHYKEETMSSLSKEFGSRGVVWVAVNSTHYMDKGANADWRKKNSLSYEILDDSPGLVGKLYSAKTTPHMFILSEEGKLIYQGAIDDDKYGDKKAGARSNYVKSALSEHLAGKPVTAPETKPYGCSVKYGSE